MRAAIHAAQRSLTERIASRIPAATADRTEALIAVVDEEDAESGGVLGLIKSAAGNVSLETNAARVLRTGTSSFARALRAAERRETWSVVVAVLIAVGVGVYGLLAESEASKAVRYLPLLAVALVFLAVLAGFSRQADRLEQALDQRLPATEYIESYPGDHVGRARTQNKFSGSRRRGDTREQVGGKPRLSALRGYSRRVLAGPAGRLRPR